ncbi:MAG: FAD-dependent oxidoreductase [Oscillospiraceae bacterium]|jgi:NADPH-dependent 2,4-dienoyl-CoA reductase/sulfur reductase-like enzyme|nr:FAD-dependent oxidoreductase [Oscillospiraceae bacterium]
MKKVDLLIVGGGPAGMGAALAAHEAGVQNILIVEREKDLGGILRQCIHTGFGLQYFKETLSGTEYADRFVKLLAGTGIEVRLASMVLDITPKRAATVLSAADGIEEIQAGAVILAMGCRERPRGALNIPGTRPAGVYTAGAAQKYVNINGYMPGKTAVILGSGDIGLIMARRMTLEGATVKMVCELMPFSGGLTRNIVQCLDDFGIPLRLSCTVTEIHGKERVEGVTIAIVDGRLQPIPGTEEFIECDTLLLSVGLIPENELSRAMGLAISPVTGGAVVDNRRETSIPGMFACGNVLHVHDLADYVTVESQIAGRGAASFLKLHEAGEARVSAPIESGNGVRYVVPQKVRTDEAEPVTLYFRVTDIYKNAQVILEKNGEALLKRKRNHFSPGEMETVKLEPEWLSRLTEADKFTVRLEIS